MNHRKVKISISWLAPLVLTLAFVLGRWGIWNYFPNPLVYTDSIKYLDVAERISSGNLPSFHHIGAGYPLFIWIFKLLGNQLFAVVIAQQVLSLFSVLLLFFVFRKNLFTAIAAILVGLLHILSDNVIKYEVWIFPDSLITSLNLIWCSLAYHSVVTQSKSSAVTSGIVAAFSILIRSSSVFFIPLTLLLCGWLFFKSKRKTSLLAALAFVVPLLITALYNQQYSIGQKFSFLTYERMEDKTYSQLVSGQKENTELSKEEEEEYILQLIDQLPDSAELKQYYLSWNLNELTKAVINCRFKRSAILTDEGIQLCCNGDMYSQHCYSLPKTSETPIEELKEQTDMLNRYLNNHKMPFKHLKYFAAHHANINMVYGQTYYSTIDHAFETTVSEINQSIYTVLSEERKPIVRAYMLANSNNEAKTASGFNQSYGKLIQDPIFKVYDLTTNKVLKPFTRHWTWPLATVIVSLLLLVQFFRSGLKDNVLFGLLLTASLSIGASLVFTIFSNPLPRYSFETEFSYTMLVFIGISILFGQPKNKQTEP